MLNSSSIVAAAANVEVAAVPFRRGSSASASGTVSFTNYLEDDLLVASAWNGSGSVISVPTGWTLINAAITDNGAYSVHAYRIALSDGADTLGTWTNSSRTVYSSYGDINTADPIGDVQVATGSATVIDHPGLTLEGNNSLVYDAVGVRNTAVIPGLRPDATNTNVSPSGSKVRVSYSGGVVSSWAAADDVAHSTSPGTTTSGHHVLVAELKGA